MKTLNNKKKSLILDKTGATSIMALMFFFVCMFVGITSLTTATGTNSKLTSLKQDEQDYIAVSSAAMVVKNHFIPAHPYVLSIDNTNPTLPFGQNEEGNPFKDDGLEFKQLTNSTIDPVYPIEIDAGNGLKKVSGKLYLEEGTIIVCLYIQEDSYEKSPMKLTFEPVIGGDSAITTYTYNTCVIEGGF